MAEPSTDPTGGGNRIVVHPQDKRPVTAPALVAPAASVSSGFWTFLRTLFVGTAGLAVLGVVGALASSAWLTVNQRAEAQKAEPWADPSFTTTAVTTGGMLARWMDNDGNLENGHSYIQGIYNLWKGKQDTKSPASTFSRIVSTPQEMAVLPPLWQIEFTRDAEAINKAASAQLDAETRETIRAVRKAELDKQRAKAEEERAKAENNRDYLKSLSNLVYE